MTSYKALNQQIFTSGEYRLVPIRFEDRYDIMQWRNEQMYHLRQSAPLTIDDQNYYFDNVVSALFDKENPDQLLFSFLKNDEFIGYGGLVHINWIDKNAEISFVMKTSLERFFFEDLWVKYLKIIEDIAFASMKFNKIFTYAYDLRPRLYTALDSAGFEIESVLKNHKMIEDFYVDILVHSKFNRSIEELTLVETNYNYAHKYFEWVNDKQVRLNSFNTENVIWSHHLKWFEQKLKSDKCELFVLKLNGNIVGQLRIDKFEDSWLIDYSIDTSYRRLNLAYKMFNLFIDKYPECKLIAKIKTTNIPSIKIFERLPFEQKDSKSDIITFYRN